MSDEATAEDFTRWRNALDCFEHGLATSRQALITDPKVELHHPWPPHELPSTPMPIELEARARALVAEADALTMELADAMAEVRVDTRGRGRSSYGRSGSGGGRNHARWSFDA